MYMIKKFSMPKKIKLKNTVIKSIIMFFKTFQNNDQTKIAKSNTIILSNANLFLKKHSCRKYKEHNVHIFWDEMFWDAMFVIFKIYRTCIYYWKASSLCIKSMHIFTCIYCKIAFSVKVNWKTSWVTYCVYFCFKFCIFKECVIKHIWIMIQYYNSTYV